MNDAGHVYLLRADVIESATGKAAAEMPLDKLVRRRLKRLERTLPTYGGQLVRHVPNGLLASFATAEAAVHGACEMQRCCAAIPQVPGTQIGLRIGIDAGPDDPDHSSPTLSAARLASRGQPDDIMVTPAAAMALTPALREKATPLTGSGPDSPALSVDWRSLPRPAVTPVAAAPEARFAPPRAPRMVLRQGGKELKPHGSRRVITIGRDPTNDIVVPDPRASRSHCRIIIQLDSFVLVDLSMNGTYLMTREGKPQLVKHKMLTLAGSGWIALGHPASRDTATVVEFEIRP